MTVLMRSCLIAAVLAVSAPALAEPAAPAPVAAQRSHARFQTFFEDFRAAVLANDREAVAAMTQFPFTDYRPGNYCEARQACEISAASATSRNKAEFLARYDRIFTPAVIAAIRDRRLRAFQSGVDDGEGGGPIVRGEHILQLDDTGDQRVFSLHGGVYKLDRIPFYS
ncbi:hypothetical protein GCM10009081_21340 [Brevundimonas nasdae]